jgi:hypothetical protein
VKCENDSCTARTGFRPVSNGEVKATVKESSAIEAPARVLHCATGLTICPFAASLLLVISLSGCCRYYTRVADSFIARPSISNHNRFATPQDAADRLVRAINGRRWRDEYECYTGVQQARFTYLVIVHARELRDSQDLFLKFEQVLQNFQLPLDLLDRFPDQRLEPSEILDLNDISDLSHISDPAVIEIIIQGQDDSQTKLERWQQEVQPLSIDWAQLIDELQPLFIENYRRHSRHSYLTEHGIVHYLDYHLFERASNIEVNGTRAEGSIVAIVRDPDVVQFGDDRQWEGSGATTWDSLCYMLEGVACKDRRLRRAPERMEFIKEGDTWKVASVPFR